MVLTIIALTFGVLGVLFGARCYLELYRWASQIKTARIVVARKGRVKMNVPLIDWLMWCNSLTGEEANGRVVYLDSGTRIAILKPDPVSGPARQALVRRTAHTIRAIRSLTHRKRLSGAPGA